MAYQAEQFEHIFALLRGLEPVWLKNPNVVPMTITGQQPVEAEYIVNNEMDRILRTYPRERDWMSVQSMEGDTFHLRVKVGYVDWRRFDRVFYGTRHDTGDKKVADTVTKNDGHCFSGTAFMILETWPVV